MKLKSTPIKTVLTLTVGFIIVYILTKWQWVIILSLIIGFSGLFSDMISNKIDYVWLKIIWILSLIFPNILLSIVYYFVLVPLAFLYKIFGKENQLTLKNTEQSLFVESQKDFSSDSFKKMW